MSCTSCNNTRLSYNTQFGATAARETQAYQCGLNNNCNYSGFSNYVIIGDTSAAVLYGARLACNGVNEANIYIMTEGGDNTGQYANFDDVNFSSISSNEQLVLMPETYLVLANSASDTFLGPPPPNISPTVWSFVGRRELLGRGADNQTVARKLNVGKGILGDLAATYIVPRIGPWFVDSAPNIQQRFFNSSQTFNLNSVEIDIYNQIRRKFLLNSSCLNIKITDQSIMLNQPSAKCQFGGSRSISEGYQMILLQPQTESADKWCPDRNNAYYTRQLFQTVQDFLKVNYITQYQALRINSANGVVSVSYMPSAVNNNINSSVTPGLVTIPNAKVIWMTNPYTYLRLVNTSGAASAIPSLPSTNIPIPLTFRTVLQIPKYNCDGVDLRGLENRNPDNPALYGTVGDGVTSYVNFSLKANSFLSGGTSKTSPVWFIQAYTTNADHYPVDVSTANADVSANFPVSEAYTLLVIEAVNTQYVRRGNYDGTNITVTYADPANEAAVAQDFLTIAANILNAYTGIAFRDVEAIANFFLEPTPSNSAVNSGIPANAIDGTPISVATLVITNLTREMTITTILQTGSWLYGNRVYPCPWSPGNGRCPPGGCQLPLTGALPATAAARIESQSRAAVDLGVIGFPLTGTL